MRRDGVVQYLHTDHLGSTSLTTTNSSGTLLTDFGFNSQRDERGIGLYDYHARFYDPALGRFINADTIVPSPGNPQDLNRYTYVRNSPLNSVDPSGHCGGNILI